MGKTSRHINQHLANLVIDKQLPTLDKNDPRKYNTIYRTSKTWLFLDLDYAIPQQLIPSVEENINSIDYQR